MTENQGPKCRYCGATEARCAFVATCCGGRSHFRHLDAQGNDDPKSGPPRTSCGSCRSHRRACVHRLRIVA